MIGRVAAFYPVNVTLYIEQLKYNYNMNKVTKAFSVHVTNRAELAITELDEWNFCFACHIFSKHNAVSISLLLWLY